VFKIIRKCESEHEYYSLATIDLDNFKQLNDRYGHGAGDVVIDQIAKRLSEFAKEHNGAAARVGGEEFKLIVSMPPEELLNKLTELKNQFSHSLSNPEQFDVKPITSWEGWRGPSFSAGISNRVGSGKEQQVGSIVSKLALDSDAALYRAKEKGRDRVEIHK